MDASTKAVFLSYASEDAEPARRICEALRTAGLEVWFDQNELRGGDAWDVEIRRRIRNCALFVPVISTNTEQRAEGYFRLEWKLAVDRSHRMSEDQAFLLPVALDGVAQTSMRVPDRFREVQWTRPSDDAAIKAFAERAQRLLVGGVAGAAAPAPASMPRPTSAETPSIAVLPFANLSRDEENEYFADGLSEELLNVLANIRGLRVASRTSAFYFKGKDTDLPTIARKLGVATVLEGSVRKSGKRVRITTQLIEVATDSHLWSKTYDRELDDIFAVQDDIAQSVVTELRTLLGGGTHSAADTVAEVKAAASGRTENAEAHELYLQGRFFLHRTTEKEVARSVECFERAIALDPTFALAWAHLSGAFWTQAGHGWVPPAEGFERAREAANRVIELAPQLAEGHVCISRVLVAADRDWAGATSALERAIALAPDNPFALRAWGRHLSFLGRGEESLQCLRKAVALDPMSAAGRTMLAGRYIFDGRFEEAAEELGVVEELNPGAGFKRFLLSTVRLQQGRPLEALTIANTEPDPTLRLTGVAMAEHSLGHADKSDAALRALVDEHRAGSAYQIAEVHAWRGETDACFEWLERAYAELDAGLSSMLMDPILARMRSDPRWPQVLEKAGFPSREPRAPGRSNGLI